GSLYRRFFVAVGSRRIRLPEGNEDGREECDRCASQFVSESWHSSDASLVNASGVKAGSRPAFLCCFCPLERRFRTTSDRARSGNKIADPVNIFMPWSALDSACHIYAKRPGLVDRFSDIFRV